jgi:hypothetical protein
LSLALVVVVVIVHGEVLIVSWVPKTVVAPKLVVMVVTVKNARRVVVYIVN